MYTINGIDIATFGIVPSRVSGEGIAVKGLWDLPKRIGDTHYSWGEANGVEPYVDADEIFLGGRDIKFCGLVIGNRATVTASVNAFKTEVNQYRDKVPFATPYGNVCVLIRNVNVTMYNGGAILDVAMFEPQVGVACPIWSDDTLYYSEEYSETADKNDCQAGYYGSTVQLTSPAGKFTSNLNQYAANQLAVQWVRENKQLYANANGTCIINPTVYYNAELIGWLRKDDCDPGYKGSLVSYKVSANKYSSIVSQVDADAKAQNEVDTVLTQEYANVYGTCILSHTSRFTLEYNESNGLTREMHINVGDDYRPNTEYQLTCYGWSVSELAPLITNDTLDEVLDAITQGLTDQINATSEAQWNWLYQAPVTGTPGFKPTAVRDGRLIKITLNHANQFSGRLINH